MPSRAVDAFIYVWKMLDQHWAKTKLARQCVRTANSLILNLLKLFLFYNFIHVDFARPCQSVPIDSAPRASQAKKRQTLLCEKAGDANYAIGFGPCRIFCCCFLFAKIIIERRAMAKNAMFFEVRASWNILGYFMIF